MYDDEYKIEMLTGQGTPPRVALSQVLEKIEEGDSVFVVVCKPGEEHEVWVKSSHFKTHQLLLAAQYLQAYAIKHVDIKT